MGFEEAWNNYVTAGLQLEEYNICPDVPATRDQIESLYNCKFSIAANKAEVLGLHLNLRLVSEADDYQVWTDGGHIGHRGSCGAIIADGDGTVQEILGGSMFPILSSYQAEHRGIVIGLEGLKKCAQLKGAKATLFCDNKGILQHLYTVKIRQRALTGGDIDILELIAQLFDGGLAELQFTWVPGHQGVGSTLWRTG